MNCDGERHLMCGKSWMRENGRWFVILYDHVNRCILKGFGRTQEEATCDAFRSY